MVEELWIEGIAGGPFDAAFGLAKDDTYKLRQGLLQGREVGEGDVFDDPGMAVGVEVDVPLGEVSVEDAGALGKKEIDAGRGCL